MNFTGQKAKNQRTAKKKNTAWLIKEAERKRKAAIKAAKKT